MGGTLTLPEGRRGQALAVALALAAAGLLWFAAAAPLLGWYEARAARWRSSASSPRIWRPWARKSRHCGRQSAPPDCRRATTRLLLAGGTDVIAGRQSAIRPASLGRPGRHQPGQRRPAARPAGRRAAAHQHAGERDGHMARAHRAAANHRHSPPAHGRRPYQHHHRHPAGPQPTRADAGQFHRHRLCAGSGS